MFGATTINMQLIEFTTLASGAAAQAARLFEVLAEQRYLSLSFRYSRIQHLNSLGKQLWNSWKDCKSIQFVLEMWASGKELQFVVSEVQRKKDLCEVWKGLSKCLTKHFNLKLFNSKKKNNKKTIFLLGEKKVSFKKKFIFFRPITYQCSPVNNEFIWKRQGKKESFDRWSCAADNRVQQPPTRADHFHSLMLQYITVVHQNQPDP